MILYRPNDGDVHSDRITYRPRTCFLMTQLGEPIPAIINDISQKLHHCLAKRKIQAIDAESEITGKDFLTKIWSMIVSVPLGIAIINEDMSPQTLSNIFYEIGLLQAYGKETLIVITNNVDLPSDFVRTEYIKFDKKFESKMDNFLKNYLKLPDHYKLMSEQLEKNPLLSIDYLRRAFLISGEALFRIKANRIFKESSIKERAKNSVEMLLVQF